MESLMFVGHDERPGDIPRESTFARRQVIVQGQEPLADTIAETNNGLDGRPVFVFLWDL